MRTTLQIRPNSRRSASRVETPEVRVYWSCGGRNDVLRARNLSFGGIFLETHKPPSVGTKAQIDFLVEEGQIRTKAVVRHVRNGLGMGLQFISIAQEDRPRLAGLLTRLRGFSQSTHRSPGQL
jgi:hypothetical protein